MHTQSYCRLILVAMLALTLTAWPTSAAPKRTRTLNYDPKQKDWVELPPPPPMTAEGDLHRIRVLVAKKRYGKAISDLKKWVARYGHSDALYPDSMILNAEGQIGRKQFDEAHETLQAFLNEFGGMSLTADALRLEIVIAEAYLAGAKRKFWGMRILNGEDVAYRILDDISANFPDSSYAELAMKAKADAQFARGEYALAELDYSRLLKEYPRTRYAQFALRRSADAALASFAGVEYDEAALIEAEERFKDYQTRFPMEARSEGVERIVDGIIESRAEKDFLIGQYYESTDHLTSAVFQYSFVARSWPQTVAASKASQRLELLGVVVAATKGS